MKLKPFKSHHSGMETTGRTSCVSRVLLFKSHHSGMETLCQGLVTRKKRPFKSHHSGMETGAQSGDPSVRHGL